MILSGGAAGVRFRSSTSLRFRDLVCPSPASSSSRPRYRVYPRVVEVVSEVAVHAAALHRRSNPLSGILLRQIHRYAVAVQQFFAAPQPVNPSFSRLAGAAAVGSMRWGSVTFAEMEHLGRLFRCQLETTSSSLWMMSGILAMLKSDGFNPSTPGLFNTAIASVSASLAFSGTYSGVGVGVPLLYTSGVSTDAFEGPDSGVAETRAHSHPVSVTGLFDEPLLNSLAAQVTEDSFVSSSLAVSKALSSCSGSKPLATSSSPIAGPSGYRPVRRCGRGGALRPPRALEAASASRVVRGRLLLRNLRVSGSGSHRLALPCPVAVCPSTGRPGGTGARFRGWWRSSRRGIAYTSTSLLLCLRNSSPCLRMPLLPSKGLLSGRSP